MRTNKPIPKDRGVLVIVLVSVGLVLAMDDQGSTETVGVLALLR